MSHTHHCAHCGPVCFCTQTQKSKGLTEEQSATNRNFGLPTNPISNYEWEKTMGYIPEDMTPEEYANRPVENANNVIDQTQEW